VALGTRGSALRLSGGVRACRRHGPPQGTAASVAPPAPVALPGMGRGGRGGVALPGMGGRGGVALPGMAGGRSPISLAQLGAAVAAKVRCPGAHCCTSAVCCLPRYPPRVHCWYTLGTPLVHCWHTERAQELSLLSLVVAPPCASGRGAAAGGCGRCARGEGRRAPAPASTTDTW